MRRYVPLWVFIKIIKTMYIVAPFSGAFILFSVFWQGFSVGIIFWLTSHILDNLMNYKDSYNFFWNNIGQWVLWMALYLTINSLLIEARVYVSSFVEKKIKLNLQQKIYSKSVSMPFSSFENPKFLDDLQNAISSLDIFLLIFISILCVIQAIIGMVITSIVFLSYSWILLGCLILISIPPLITRAFFAKKVYEVQHSAIQGKRLADYLKSILTRREFAKEVRLFNIGEYIANRWFKTSQLYSKAYRQTLWRQERSIFTVQVMSSVFYVACVVFIANSTINQTLTIGLFVALIQAVQRFQEHINLLTSQLAIYVQFSTPIGVAYKFLEADSPNNKNDEQLAELPTCIEFDSVSFIYPDSEKYALKDVSFVINAGERIAICGQNGAGKSTLVKLILGFYRPSEGVIRINGKDISELDMEQIRQKITAVFQDFVRYQLRFRENIGFGDISQITDDHKLFEVASKVKVDDLIHNATNSMDTQLGNQFTNGMDISGGQWQKLAIARAHLKNASIIVMDEPTSALDPMSEAGLYKDFLEISGENTAIYISHRTGLARLADRIIVLKDGLLIEDGSHDELLNYDGEYADFFNAQAKWYKKLSIG